MHCLGGPQRASGDEIACAALRPHIGRASPRFTPPARLPPGVRLLFRTSLGDRPWPREYLEYLERALKFMRTTFGRRPRMQGEGCAGGECPGGSRGLREPRRNAGALFFYERWSSSTGAVSGAGAIAFHAAGVCSSSKIRWILKWNSIT